MDTSAIHHITDESELFTPLLREIAQPPRELFVRGNVKILQSENMLAVVGSRKFSEYGRQCVQKLLPQVVQAGVIIVSGMAYGIDSLAHGVSVNLKKPTVAILGTGVDSRSIYPRTHIKLAHQIIANGGAVVSEYPAGTPAYKGSFPARNRIVAGMSRGALIVQAAEKSGSLITARLALESNREVGIVPGPITDKGCAGSNDLLQQGATPILNSQDLLDWFGIDLKLEIKSVKHDRADWSDNQKRVMVVFTSDPVSLDVLLDKTTLPPSVLTAELTQLELQGVIENVGGMRYIRK